MVFGFQCAVSFNASTTWFVVIGAFVQSARMTTHSASEIFGRFGRRGFRVEVFCSGIADSYTRKRKCLTRVGIASEIVERFRPVREDIYSAPLGLEVRKDGPVTFHEPVSSRTPNEP